MSTYEAFTLESIRDWGTEELIAKAESAQAAAKAAARQPVPPAVESGLEADS